MNINDWAIYLNDEQVNKGIKRYEVDLLKLNEEIDSKEIIEVYLKITNNKELNNRAQLFYIMKFEDLLIKSRIRDTEGVVKFKNSLFS